MQKTVRYIAANTNKNSFETKYRVDILSSEGTAMPQETISDTTGILEHRSELVTPHKQLEKTIIA